MAPQGNGLAVMGGVFGWVLGVDIVLDGWVW